MPCNFIMLLDHSLKLPVEVMLDLLSLYLDLNLLIRRFLGSTSVGGVGSLAVAMSSTTTTEDFAFLRMVLINLDAIVRLIVGGYSLAVAKVAVDAPVVGQLGSLSSSKACGCACCGDVLFILSFQRFLIPFSQRWLK